MTRIFISRKPGEPLGRRPIVIERGQFYRLAGRVTIHGPSEVVVDLQAPEGRPKVWIATESRVEAHRK